MTEGTRAGDSLEGEVEAHGTPEDSGAPLHLRKRSEKESQMMYLESEKQRTKGDLRTTVWVIVKGNLETKGEGGTT
jgi:hypothetical protein